MSLLQLVRGTSHFIVDRLSVGVYAIPKTKNCVLIDSGIDAEKAKKISQALKKASLTPVAIINTHSHADHCGGNAYFQSNFKDIEIIASKFESHFICEPTLEPLCFCAGAAPFAELENKHLHADASVVTRPLVEYKDQTITVGGADFRILALPGHTPGMIAVISPDNVLYTGDAIFGQETLDKHGVLFYTNIAETLASFDKLKNIHVDDVVFYHGGKLQNQQLIDVIEQHKNLILSTNDLILNVISEKVKNGISLDALTAVIMKERKIPNNVMQFTLTKTCINAYVQYLQATSLINLHMNEHCLLTVVSKSTKPADESKKAHEDIKVLYDGSFYRVDVLAGDSQHEFTIVYSIKNKDHYLKHDMHCSYFYLSSIDEQVKIMRSSGLITNKPIAVNSCEPFEEYAGIRFQNPEPKVKASPFGEPADVSIELDESQFKLHVKIPENFQGNPIELFSEHLAGCGIVSHQNHDVTLTK